MKLLRAVAVLVAAGLLFGVVATAQARGKKAAKTDAGTPDPMFLPASKSGPMPFPHHQSDAPDPKPKRDAGEVLKQTPAQLQSPDSAPRPNPPPELNPPPAPPQQNPPSPAPKPSGTP